MVLPMLYRVIKWSERTKREEYGRKLTFINRTKEKYYLENYELQEEEGLTEDEDGPLTELPAELPGIEIQS